MTRLVLTLWLVVCATITLHAGHAAHHWVTVASALPDQHRGLDSSAFWHTYLRSLQWGVFACAAAGVSLVSVAGSVLRSKSRATSLLRHRLAYWLVAWTLVLLLCGVTAYQWLTQASSLAGTGQITPAFWHAYLQFHLWAVLASVALLVGLLGVNVALRRVVTLWPSAGGGVAILVGLGSLYWLTHIGGRVAQAGLADPAFWHPFLRFQLWVLIAYVTALIGVLGASMARRRVVTVWPTGGIGLAIIFSIAAWNAIYVSRVFGFEARVVGRSWDLYLRFHYWATLSFFTLLVGVVGAGLAVLYIIDGQQHLFPAQRQPMEDRVPLNDDPAPTVPSRPLGVTVLGGIYLLSSILMLSSLLIQQTPQVILAIPISLSLGLGFLGQRRWSWEVGMLYFGVIPVVSWSIAQVGAPIAPWSQVSPVANALLLLYLWSVRRVFVA